MKKEEYNKIISYTKESLSENLLKKITNFNYNELGGYYVIQVYIKSDTKAKAMAEILVNIEDFAKEYGFNVLVDFLRG